MKEQHPRPRQAPALRPDYALDASATDGTDEDTDTNIRPGATQSVPRSHTAKITDDAASREMRSTRVMSTDEMLPVTPGPGAAKDPETLGDFRLIEKLGEGAMGAVFKARQLSFDRDVALKVLFPHVAKNPKLVERLHREGLAMATLDHPNIVQAYAIDEVDNYHYVAMEFVHGQNLQKWLKQIGRFPVGDAVAITLACARGLAYAHKQGVVHRDIKPDNVLLTQAGAVKIADLGMVKTFDDDMSLTQTGHAVGTPWYMPLEQAKNAKDTDCRCDIYALGCTLYCLLTGNPPFAAGTILDVIRAKEQGTFPPARSTNPDVPERLDLLIAKMTAKQPRYRYPTCEELIVDLEALGLASKTLSILEKPAAPAPSRPPSGEIVSITAAEAEPDPDIWYVRLKGPGGQPVLRKYTTSQLQKRLEDKSVDPRSMASHSPKDSFRALATFKVFEGTALSRASKEAADKSAHRYRNLYKKIDEQDRRREEIMNEQRAGWSPWIGNALFIGGIAVGVALLGIFLWWVATSLGR